MGNFIDYLNWRGDLTFDNDRLNIVDIELFSQIVMLDFKNILINKPMKLKDVFKLYKEEKRHYRRIGLLIPDTIIDAFILMAKSRRFENVIMSDYVDYTNENDVCQFSATTFDLGDTIVICFRPTDDSIVGWEENVSMMYTKQTKAEEYALRYVPNVISKFVGKRIIVCGHSKGGHLALYSALNLNENVYNKIERFYNFDGQGIRKEVYSLELIEKRINKVTELCPQTSLVGRLFYHPENHLVCHSMVRGILQHDSFSWEIMGNDFVYDEKIDRESKEIENAINEAIDSMNFKQREEFCNALFGLMYDSNSHTLLELYLHKKELLSTYLKIGKEKRLAITKPISKLIKSRAFGALVIRSAREAKTYNMESLLKDKEI